MATTIGLYLMETFGPSVNVTTFAAPTAGLDDFTFTTAAAFAVNAAGICTVVETLCPAVDSKDESRKLMHDFAPSVRSSKTCSRLPPTPSSVM